MVKSPPPLPASDDRGRALSASAGLIVAAVATGLAMCPGDDRSEAPEASPSVSLGTPSPVMPEDVDIRRVRRKVGRELRATRGGNDDDDSPRLALPSVSIDPDVFEDGLWGLSEVSRCLRTFDDVISTSLNPDEMMVYSTRDDGQSRVPVSVKKVPKGVWLKVVDVKVFYGFFSDAPQEDVEGILTQVCWDVLLAVQRTDWSLKELCQGPDDGECSDKVGEYQMEGSEGVRPVEMMNDLLALVETQDFFTEITRYQSNAFSVDPRFSRGLGYFAVKVERGEIGGESRLVYSVTASSVGGFHEFATPEEVVEFIFEHVEP